MQQKRHTEVINVATANLLNLALPERVYYANKKPYNQKAYQQKIDGLADYLRVLQADFIAVQEVWDEAALNALAKRIDYGYTTVSAPLAVNLAAKLDKTGNDNNGYTGGATGTPSVGFMTRLEVLHSEHFVNIPTDFQIDIPDMGKHKTFARPPVLAKIASHHGRIINVLTLHLKSKRPKLLRDANGEPLEDVDDPKVRVKAKLRSLFIRATEAAAIRSIIIDKLYHTREPLILMGDVNDSSMSVTTQLMAETSEVAYDRSSKDIALFNAYEHQTKHKLGKDVAYSHIYQGYPEVLDQIFVSEEFLPNSKYSKGEVLQVDYINDYLKLSYNQRFTDHGLVRARIKLEDK